MSPDFQNFSRVSLDLTPTHADNRSMTQTLALAESAPHLADEWTPTQEDWEWYMSEMHDDFEELVITNHL